MNHHRWDKFASRLIAIGLMCLALTTHAASTVGYTAQSSDHWIQSRQHVSIPVTLTLPLAEKQGSNNKHPLVLLIHGHGGTRHEAGGYTRVADGLAAQGIASIRMDFPGCGASTESFSNNNLSNMLADIEAAKIFALHNTNIDSARIGLLGFSMGGRLAIKLAADNSTIQAMALWAPAATNGAGNMQTYLGGIESYSRMKAQAKNEGYAPFTTFWGQKQQLGYRWFTDLEASTPGVDIQKFQGALFVLYGDLDDVVKPEISEAVIRQATNTSSVKRYVVHGADHGLGLFNDDMVRSEQAVSNTIKFFSQQFHEASLNE